MKRSARYALLLCLFLTTFAYANITLNGESVHVETDNYIVQFNKGVIEYIHNKLTDETYTHPKPRGEAGYTGLCWREKKVLTKTATLVSATQLPSNAVELLYRQDGTEVLLAIAVDPMTDDLLIDMEGVSDTPGVVGMQWGISYLDVQNLSIIAPVDGGRIIDATSPKNSFYNFSRALVGKHNLLLLRAHAVGCISGIRTIPYSLSGSTMGGRAMDSLLTLGHTIKRLLMRISPAARRCGDSIHTLAGGGCRLGFIGSGWNKRSIPDGYQICRHG